MKQLLITIAAVMVVGCCESDHQHSHYHGHSHAEGDHDHAESDGHDHDKELKAAETVAEAATPEPTTAKAPDISIHDAAWKGNIEVVMQHIAAGTNLNVKNVHRLGQHRTPLYYAAKRGHKDIVMLLIAADADVNVKFENGKTTLDWLSSSGEMADLLRKHGGKRGNELKVHRK